RQRSQNLARRLPGLLQFVDAGDAERRLPPFVNTSNRLTMGRFRCEASHSGTLQRSSLPQIDAWLVAHRFWPTNGRNGYCCGGCSASVEIWQVDYLVFYNLWMWATRSVAFHLLTTRPIVSLWDASGAKRPIVVRFGV